MCPYRITALTLLSGLLRPHGKGHGLSVESPRGSGTCHPQFVCPAGVSMRLPQGEASMQDGAGCIGIGRLQVVCLPHVLLQRPESLFTPHLIGVLSYIQLNGKKRKTLQSRGLWMLWQEVESRNNEAHAIIGHTSEVRLLLQWLRACCAR